MWIDLLPLLVPAEATTERPLGKREDWCLICDEPRQLAVARVERRLAWLGVPLGRGRFVGYRLACGRCGGTFGLPGDGRGEALQNEADGGDEFAGVPYLMDDVTAWSRAVEQHRHGKLPDDIRRQTMETVVGRLVHAGLPKPGLMHWPLPVTVSVIAVAVFFFLAMSGLGQMMPNVPFIIGCIVMVVVSGIAAVGFDRLDQRRRWRRAFDPVLGRVLRDLDTTRRELTAARRVVVEAVAVRKQRDEAPSLSRMKRLLRT